MGNVSSLRGALPCHCLPNRKVLPQSELPPITVANENGHVPAAAVHSELLTTNGAKNGVPGLPPASNGAPTVAASAYLNTASVGSAASLLQTYSKDNCPLCFLLIGLDGSGKTTLLQNVLQRYPPAGSRRGSQVTHPVVDMSDPKPTLGFSKQDILYKKHHVVLHDLGGGASIRGIWRNYFAEAHGIIFVIDSSLPLNGPRWDELSTLVDGLTAADNLGLHSKPILILLNKQDVRQNYDESAMRSRINIRDFMELYSCPVKFVPVCLHEKQLIRNSSAKRQLCQKNIEEALLWVVAEVEDKFPSLHMKVQFDSQQQIQKEEELRRNRAARLKAAREAREAEEGPDDDMDLPVGISPFVPLNEHLQQVGKRLSIYSVTSAKKRPASSDIPATSALSLSRSVPNIRRLSDDYSLSDIMVDETLMDDSARTQQRWSSSVNLRPGVNGNAGDGGSISDDEDLSTQTLKLKTSRPPVYKRIASGELDEPVFRRDGI